MVSGGLAPEAFGTCFRAWVRAWGEIAHSKVIAIDGKTLRHSFDQTLGQPAVHRVRAWAAEARLVLGALPTDAESNEIPAVRALLALLDLSGAIVTADAEHAQKETAASIRERGGHYLLALKDNPQALEDREPTALRPSQSEGAVGALRQALFLCVLRFGRIVESQRDVFYETKPIG